MEANTFMMPIGGKSILRSTGEEVEIIDFNQPNKGMRTESKDLTFEVGDWVTYIDSNGNEHIREHLNLQLDFKPVVNDTWNSMFDWAKNNNKMPTTRNCRIFEVAKELLIHNGTLFDIDELVNQSTELVDKVGVETN